MKDLKAPLTVGLILLVCSGGFVYFVMNFLAPERGPSDTTQYKVNNQITQLMQGYDKNSRDLKNVWLGFVKIHAYERTQDRRDPDGIYAAQRAHALEVEYATVYVSGVYELATKGQASLIQLSEAKEALHLAGLTPENINNTKESQVREWTIQVIKHELEEGWKATMLKGSKYDLMMFKETLGEHDLKPEDVGVSAQEMQAIQRAAANQATRLVVEPGIL